MPTSTCRTDHKLDQKQRSLFWLGFYKVKGKVSFWHSFITRLRSLVFIFSIFWFFSGNVFIDNLSAVHKLSMNPIAYGILGGRSPPWLGHGSPKQKYLFITLKASEDYSFEIWWKWNLRWNKVKINILRNWQPRSRDLKIISERS